MSWLPRAPAAVGALILLLWLAGCATPQTASLLAKRPAGVAERVELTSVPFHPQEIHQCGPAALATALGSAGVELSPDALIGQVYLPGRKGSLQPEMLAAARRQGLVAYPLAPSLDDLLREVAAGTPVVVLQNLSFSFAPVWHYAVVVGYDLPKEELVLRSGTTERLIMTLAQFERTWAKGDHWAMVALPPDRLPATAREETYLSAAVALERTSPAAAQRAYATALRQWPKSLVARMGLGNTAYALNDLSAAEAAYRQATMDHPDAGDAWNNLAQALAELGRQDEASSAAKRAVAIGGARKSIYEATLRGVSHASPGSSR